MRPLGSSLFWSTLESNCRNLLATELFFFEEDKIRLSPCDDLVSSSEFETLSREGLKIILYARPGNTALGGWGRGF